MSHHDHALEPVFQPEWLARFQYLALKARRCGPGPLLRMPRRTLPGGGTEATAVRDYTPGDSLRYVDWNLCARRDEVLTKTFEGETDRRLAVLLDASRSMGDGCAGYGASGEAAGAKFRLARHIAAAAGCWALNHSAMFSLVAFAGTLGPSLPGLRGRWHTVRLLRFLESLPLQDSPTDLHGAVAAFVRRRQRRGPVLVISDLLDHRGFQAAVDLLRYHGYEPRIVHLHSPPDAEPPALGDVELVDCETGRRQRVTVTERAAARYRALFDRFLDEVKDYCRRHALPWLQLSTDVPIDQAIPALLGLPGPAGCAKQDARHPMTHSGR